MIAAPSRGRRRPSRALGAAVFTLLLAGTACVVPVPADDVPPSAQITANPSLFPAFRTSIVDYVARCADAPITVSVDAPDHITVSVDGSPAATGTFTEEVTRGAGQRFTIVVDRESTVTTHHVRCLPGDFPAWSAQQHGPTHSAWYVTVPNVGITNRSYAVVFDTNGVPVWWSPKNAQFYAFERGGNIAWNVGGLVEEHRLDGSLARTYSTVGEPFDFHDLVVLPNGNHLVVSASPKDGVDLSSWGGPSDATIVDHVVQEVAPGGALVWSWRTSDHIGVEETTTFWRNAELADPGGVFTDDYDPYHWNAVAADGDGVILSFRHLDAVVKVNRSDGAIVWKLGGTQRAESLTVVDDPVFASGGGGGFGGQHDARLLGDGTLTIYDNGSGRNRPPRGVRYRLDLAQRTATLVQVVTDAAETSSFCCGSFRQSQLGNTVFGWGGNVDSAPDITETTETGTRVFELSFTGPQVTVYRAIPVTPLGWSRAALRAGMDAQYPG